MPLLIFKIGRAHQVKKMQPLPKIFFPSLMSILIISSNVKKSEKKYEQSIVWQVTVILRSGE